MGFSRGPRYKSVSEVTGPSGFYRIWLNAGPVTVYVDQEYDGGGWAMVLANRRYTAGMNNLTYDNAINSSNYRSGGSDDASNTTVTNLRTLNTLGLSGVNTWVGLKYWSELAGRVNANSIKVVQYAHSSIVPLSGTHTFRSSWKTTGFSSTYGFTGANSLTNLVGGTTPGMWSHAASSNSLTTFDNDQDTNGGNCSTYYNNNPWWYSSCWTGNYFAGGGHIDGPYWVSSGSGNSVGYGAVYIK